MALPIAISAASLAISFGGFSFSVFRAFQENAAKASKLNYEYGEKIRPKMSFFTEYKAHCAQKSTSYTEAFVQYRDEWDKKAEEYRGFLAGFWDQVAEDHKKWLLPSDFFSADHGKWLQRAANYKELVEPIDIANYVRLGFAAGSGGYFEHNNRPSQYVYIEKLQKDAVAEKP